MKHNRFLSQVIVVVMTFLIMAMLIWGVWTGRLLDHKQMREQMIDELIK